jgi:CRP-like cAMP-binding protein
MNILKLEALRDIEIFRDLSSHEVEKMDRELTMSTCRAGRVFYGPEDQGEVLFLLKKGRVQLYRISPEGKKLIIAVLGPGSIFGEMSLVGQGMHNSFAEALEDCTLCVMSRSDVERMLLEKPQVALRFMEAMAHRLRAAECKLEEIAFRSIPGRLAALLLSLADRQNGLPVVEGYTHQDLAEMVGTYRETATQTLNQFKARGWVEIERKRVRLLNWEALEDQALQ